MCQIEKRAKEKAIKEALGLKISLEELKKNVKKLMVLNVKDNQTSVLSKRARILRRWCR